MVSEPVFLVGSERSGTTLLRLMLNFHPQITWLNEFEYAVDMIDATGSFPALEKYYAWLDTHRIFRMSGMTIDHSLSYPELVNSFLCQRRARFSKPLIGATVHRHFDRLLSIWPDARFIYIVRDPRDVSRSCVIKGWAGNVWMGLQRWMDAEACWAQLSPQIPADRKIEITYQDLVASNRETLERICTFIGVAYSPEMLDYVHSTDYSLPDPKLLKSWRRHLSERDVQLVEARVGEQLAARGFELSGLPKIQLSPFDLAYLKLQNRVAKILFRVKRYGLGLLLADFVTRRLNLSALHRPFRLKMNEIEISLLKKSW